MDTRIICDLAPTSENRRNSEGSFLTLKDGRILFAYSRFGSNSWHDNAASDIYGILSDDNGEHFSEPFPIITHEQADADNVMSVSMLRMENGDVGLFFLAKRSFDQCLLHLIRSTDEGKTWSKPYCCFNTNGYFVVNNDRVIRTKSGRILASAAMHKSTFKTVNGVKEQDRHYPGEMVVFASDDDGFTWQLLAENIHIPFSRGLTVGVQEPGLLQRKDGSLWCYIRTDAGAQYECFSYDDGKTWTAPLPSSFTSCMSPMSTKYLSDGRILAVWNPIPVYNGRTQYTGNVWTGGRTPLAIAFSEDDSETFTQPILIETDENSGFCYTAIHETEDGILLGYCAGGEADASCLSRLRIRKIYKEK